MSSGEDPSSSQTNPPSVRRRHPRGQRNAHGQNSSHHTRRDNGSSRILNNLPLAAIQAALMHSNSTLPQSRDLSSTNGGSQPSIWVSAQTDPNTLAGSIAHTIRKGDTPTVMAIGVKAVNQAIKAIAIARGFLVPDRVDLSVTASYRDAMDKLKLSFYVTKTVLRTNKQQQQQGSQGGVNNTNDSTSNGGTTQSQEGGDGAEAKEDGEGVDAGHGEEEVEDVVDESGHGDEKDNAGGEIVGESQPGDEDHEEEGDKGKTFGNHLRVAQSSNYGVVAGAIAKKLRVGERPTVTCIGGSSVGVAILSLLQARRYLRQDGIDVAFRPQFVHLDVAEGSRSGIRFQILRRDI